MTKSHMKKTPVYTEADEEKFNKVLKEIQGRVPKAFLLNVVVKEKLTPTIEFVMNKAIEDEKIPQEKRDAIKTLLDAGEFTRVKSRENPVFAKKIEEFVNREINKAIKAGRLPPKSHVSYFPSVIRANKDPNESNKA